MLTINSGFDGKIRKYLINKKNLNNNDNVIFDIAIVSRLIILIIQDVEKSNHVYL